MDRIALLTRTAARAHAPRRLLLKIARTMPPRECVARIDGACFQLDTRDNVQRELLYLGSYEPALSGLLERELRAGDVFADIGAHVGVHTLAAARSVAPGGRVFAFEPDPETAAKLRRMVASSGLEAVAETVEAAVGAEPGRRELRAPPEWDPKDSAVRSLHLPGRAVASVEVVVFDEWFSGERLDAVKVDVEGGELDVLRGMEKTLDRVRPRLLIIEEIPSLLRTTGASEGEVAALLGAHGYEAEYSPELAPNVVWRP